MTTYSDFNLTFQREREREGKTSDFLHILLKQDRAYENN